MADADTLRRIALALEGTVEAPHFDRAAFKVRTIYATLAADRMTANLKLAPDEQTMKCEMRPEAFAPVPNAWGARGWTLVRLDAVDIDELGAVLEMAWRHALPKRTRRRRS